MEIKTKTKAIETIIRNVLMGRFNTVLSSHVCDSSFFIFEKVVCTDTVCFLELELEVFALILVILVDEIVVGADGVGGSSYSISSHGFIGGSI
jgi:hypothetical protein